MPLPPPQQGNPQGMNASQMRQYQEWTAKEAIKTAFSASVLTMQSKIIEKGPLLRFLPGAGILKERAEMKKRELYEKQGRDETGRKLTKQELEEREKRRKDMGALAEIKDLIVDTWADKGVPLGALVDDDTKFLFERMDVNLKAIKDSISGSANAGLFGIQTYGSNAGGQDQERDGLEVNLSEESMSDMLDRVAVMRDANEPSDSEQSSLAQEMEEANLEAEQRDEERNEQNHTWFLKDFIDQMVKKFKGAGLVGGTGGAGGEGGGGIFGKIKDLIVNNLPKVLPAIGGMASSLGTGAMNLGRSAISAIGQTGFGKTIAQAGSEVGKIGKGALEFGGKAIDKVKGFGGSVMEKAGELAGKGGGVLSSIGGWFGKMAGKVGLDSIGKFIKSSAGKILKGIATFPGIGALISGAMSAWDIKNVKDDPNLSKDEKREKIGVMLVEALGKVLGMVGGGALGTLVPFPGLGTILGSLGGEWLGGKIAGMLGEAVGGKKIYDMVSSIPGIGSLVNVEEGIEDVSNTLPSQTVNVDSAKQAIDKENEERKSKGMNPLSDDEVNQRMEAARKQDAGITPITQSNPVASEIASARVPTGVDIASTSAQNQAMKEAPVNNTSINSNAAVAQQNNNTVVASAPSAYRTGADMSPVFSGSLAFG